MINNGMQILYHLRDRIRLIFIRNIGIPMSNQVDTDNAIAGKINSIPSIARFREAMETHNRFSIANYSQAVAVFTQIKVHALSWITQSIIYNTAKILTHSNASISTETFVYFLCNCRLYSRFVGISMI